MNSRLIIILSKRYIFRADYINQHWYGFHRICHGLMQISFSLSLTQEMSACECMCSYVGTNKKEPSKICFFNRLSTQTIKLMIITTTQSLISCSFSFFLSFFAQLLCSILLQFCADSNDYLIIIHRV